MHECDEPLVNAVLQSSVEAGLNLLAMQADRASSPPSAGQTPYGLVGATTPAQAKDSGNSITCQGFKISTHKLPILKAEPIDQMNASLGITVPEMIFGDNSVRIEHERSGFSIEFNTFDALDRVDKTGDSMLKVAHSQEWHSTRWAVLFARGIATFETECPPDR